MNELNDGFASLFCNIEKRKLNLIIDRIQISMLLTEVEQQSYDNKVKIIIKVINILKER